MLLTRHLLILACLTSVFSPKTGHSDQTDLELLEEQTFQSAVEKVSASVLRIETFGGLDRVGKLMVGTGPTTGLVIAEDGYLVSSAFNFIQQPSSILVTLPNTDRAPARIVARDQSRMLVLLKVETEERLPVPEIVPRAELRVGQWAIAIGRTFEQAQPNISVGIISAVNRIWGKAIQTDAKISPGNYGGPLVDLQGRVLGVLSPLSPTSHGEVAGAEWYDSGIGFAIPLTEIIQRLDIWKTGVDLTPGLLGVVLKGSDIYALPAEVASTLPKSPARAAGLQVGDIIVEAESQPIFRQAQLKHVLGRLYSGDRIQLIVLRGDERIPMEAELAKNIEPYEHPFLGAIADRQVTEGKGVSIRYVYADSPAAQAGLFPDDQLITLADRPIQRQEDIYSILAEFEPDMTIAAELLRKGDPLTVTLKAAHAPTLIPESILPAVPPSPEALDGKRSEVVEIKLPEEPNNCVALIPTNYDPTKRYGLVVFLHASGKFDQDSLFSSWQEHCVQRELILLAPQSADAARWVPSEVDFIRKVIDQILGQYSINRNRLVICGHEAGGAMAYLVGFRFRELVRGIGAIDASLPARAQIPPNDPIQRLSFYSVAIEKSPLASRISAGNAALRERKYPVTERTAKDPWSESNFVDLVHWIDSIDRF